MPCFRELDFDLRVGGIDEDKDLAPKRHADPALGARKSNAASSREGSGV